MNPYLDWARSIRYHQIFDAKGFMHAMNYLYPSSSGCTGRKLPPGDYSIKFESAYDPHQFVQMCGRVNRNPPPIKVIVSNI